MPFGIAVLVILGVFAIALRLKARGEGHEANLGRMSERWLAEHRAAHS